jgi:Flp pilus assembly pilin Flp
MLTLVTYWQVSAAELNARLRREEGQTMAEYGVVLAVVILAVIASLTLLATHVRGAITSVSNLLPGG